MINRRKFFKKVLRKAFSILTVLAVIFSSLSPAIMPAPLARAATAIIAANGNMNNFGPGAFIPPSSPAIALAKISVTADAAGKTFNSVTANFSGTNFDVTDLATLANNATSGVALYGDNGATLGEFDFNGSDTIITLASAPVWASGNVTLTPNAPIALAIGSAAIFHIIVRTSGTIGNEDQVIATIPANAVITTGLTGPAANFTANWVKADTAAAEIQSVEAFENSPTVTVRFNKPVQKKGGGNLAAANFTYTDATGAKTISSVSHTAGQNMATITLSGNVVVDEIDASPSTIAAVVVDPNKITDMGGAEIANTAKPFASPLTILTNTIPAATAGVTYAEGAPLVTFTAKGGTPSGSAYKWSVSSADATLLNSKGFTSLTATPANNVTGKLFGVGAAADTPGSFSFTLTVTDYANPTPATFNKVLTLNIMPSGGGGIPGISGITPAGGPQGAVNMAVTVTGVNTAFTTASNVEFISGGVIDTSLTVSGKASTSGTNLSFNLSISSLSTLGSRDVRITSGTQVAYLPNGFGIFAGGASGLTLQFPTDAATNVQMPPGFSFNPTSNNGANTYRVTVKSTSNFAGSALWDYVFPKPADGQNTNGSHCSSTSCNLGYGNGTFRMITQPTPLAPNTTYYWQARTYAEATASVSDSATALESTSVRSFTTTGSITDVQPPNIQHRPIFQATASVNLVIFARVMDNLATKDTTPQLTTSLVYCKDANNCAPGTTVNGEFVGSGYYKYTITGANVPAVHATTGYIRYYLQASDGTNTALFKQGSDPFLITTKAAGAAGISGTVSKSPSGCDTSIESATVFADGAGFSAASSNAAGGCAFTLSNMTAGSYDLIAVKDGFADRRIDGVPTGSAGIAFNLSQGGTGGFGGDMSKPHVKFNGPMEGMSGIPGNDMNFKIFVAFDKAMSQTSITASGNMTVKKIIDFAAVPPATADIAGSWAYYSAAPNIQGVPPESNIAVFTLSAPFGDNQTIAVVASSGVTDTAGNSVQGNQSDGSYAFMFTTGSSANFSGFNATTGTFSTGGTFGSGAFMPPHVKGTSPAPGNFNVPPNAKVIINFSDPMADDITGVYSLAGNVKLFTVAEVSPFTETEVTSSAINTVVLDTAKTNATVNLKSAYNGNTGKFIIGTKYRLQVLGGAKAASGMTISPPNQASNTMFTSDFKIGSTEDAGAPAIIGSYPNTNDTNVPTTLGAINVAFSKDMDASTITSGAFYLSVGSTAVNGAVEYYNMERQAFFMPKSALSPNTTYTINITAGVKAMNGTAITAVTRNFTTGAADVSAPNVNFVNVDDYYLAVTFSKPMNSAAATDSMNFAASVLKPGNLALAYGVAGFSAPGTAIAIPASASFSYDPATSTLSVQGYHGDSVTAAQLAGKEILVTVSNVKDIGGIAISGATGRAPIKDSTVTKGALGPMAMSGSAFDMGGGFVPANFSSTTFGFAPPVEVMPFNKMAGQTTIYGVRIPISRQILAGGMIILTFPTGFDVAGAKQDVNSPMRTDLNGPGDGTPTFKCNIATGGTSCFGSATVTGDTSGGGDAATRGGLADDGVIVNSNSRTVTIYLSAATRLQSSDAHDFLTIDIAGIKNSTVPKDFNTSGYTIDIKTKNADTVLESLTSMPFFIQGATGTTYTLSGTITAADVTGGSMKVYLMSPMTGPMEQEITFTGPTKTYSFIGLPAGGYGLFTDQFISLSPSKDFAGKAFPENLFITANKTYDFELTSAATGTEVTITVTGPANENIDVFASSPSGFRVKQKTLTGGADAVILKLPDGQWFMGVGPQMPKGPMSGPPPSPSYLPPKPFEVKIGSGSCTIDGTATCAKSITLSTSSKEIKGLVQDGTGKTMANAQVFAYSPQGGFGTNAQTDSNGSFTLRVADGSYTVGAFIPGMPPSKEVSVIVTSHATDYLLISGAAVAITPAAAATAFILKVAKPDYTISGKVTDGTNVVQGASVYAYRTNGPGGANAITDSSGNYTIYVSAGTWKVGTFLPQYGNLTELNVSVTTANVANQNFSPSQTGTFRKVSGTVTSNSAAVQGAFVTIRNSTTANEAITATDGTYSFNVPVGTGYIIKATIPGVGETVPLDAFDVAGSDITGKNIAPATAPKAVTITFTAAPTKAFVELVGETGFRNRVEVNNTTTASLSVPDGNYNVRIDVPGAAIGLTSIAATDSNTTTYSNTTGKITVNSAEGLTVTMPDIKTLTGTVKDASGNNLADAWVEIFDPANGGVHFGVKAGANGAFSLKVAYGSYMINAMKPGYYRAPTALAVNAGTSDQTITVAAASTTIEGTVYIGSSGAANAFIRAEKQGGGFAGAQADANGVYKLYVTSGIWRVYAVAEGYAETAYASNPVDVSSASVTGKNITVSTAVNMAAPKSKSITPANGGTLEDTETGIKVTFPGTSLGSSTSSGNVEAKETNNVRETSTSKPLKSFDSTTGTYINSGKTITATVVNSSGSSTAVTNLSQPATIEMTYTKAELAATASAADSSINTKAEADAVKMGYWDESTASWVTQPTTITYKKANGDIITDMTTIDSADGTEFNDAVNGVAMIIISATTDHLSLYAPVSTVGTTPPGIPADLAATASNSSQINLSWTLTSGATSYDIYRSTSSSGVYTRLGSEPTVASGSTVAYSDSTGLSASTAYYYKITSLNGTGESAASSSVTATTSNAGRRYVDPTPTPTSTPTPTPTSVSASVSAPVSPATPVSSPVPTATPTPTPTPVATATPAPTVAPATPAAVSGVTLYRAEGDSRVYVVKDGKKSWVKSAEEFSAAGYKWSDIKVTAPSIVAALPDTTAAATASKVKVVNTPTLRVRQSNTAASSMLGTVKGSETFTVLDQKNGWYKITTSAGVTGWISGAYAAPAETAIAAAPSGATISITVSSLRVRSSNSVAGKVLGSVRKNEKYSVLEENAGWYKIKTSGGITGWVSGAYAAKQ